LADKNSAAAENSASGAGWVTASELVWLCRHVRMFQILCNTMVCRTFSVGSVSRG